MVGTVTYLLSKLEPEGTASRSVTTCLKRLGFCNNLAFASAKKLGEISMRVSFCIWVARNLKVWSPDIDLIQTKHPTVKKEKSTPDSLKKSTPLLSEPPKSPARTEPPKSNEASTYHAGFINKGNTCYANSISICHSGTLAAGHYTAHILHKQDSHWLLCNDKAVLPIQSSVLFFSFFLSTLSKGG